jgi:hypothetical protein
MGSFVGKPGAAARPPKGQALRVAARALTRPLCRAVWMRGRDGETALSRTEKLLALGQAIKEQRNSLDRCSSIATMTFKIVFDAAHQGYAAGWFPAYGLIFVVIGALLVFAPQLMQRIMPAGLQSRSRRIFSWFFFIFALSWTLVTFFGTYGGYSNARNALDSGKYSVVEGPVTQFVPMPYTGHSEESFVVGGKRFSYSDFIVTSGFHNTASHGGPIRAGLYVRVSYVGNVILRLEIAE